MSDQAKVEESEYAEFMDPGPWKYPQDGQGASGMIDSTGLHGNINHARRDSSLLAVCQERSALPLVKRI